MAEMKNVWDECDADGSGGEFMHVQAFSTTCSFPNEFVLAENSPMAWNDENVPYHQS